MNCNNYRSKVCKMESRIEACCQNCGTTDGTLFQCQQCYVISYCSQSCEKADAESHARVCYTKKEKKPSKRVSDIIGYEMRSLFNRFFIYMDSDCFSENVVQRVIARFPLHDVTTDFVGVPHSDVGPKRQTKLVLLAQIHKKDEDSKNIFIKDIFGTTLYVIFNLKSSYPFFNWSDLKPNKMICFKNPIHYTYDGNLVFCINDPKCVKLM